MAVLLKNVTNSIWHAFNALYQEKQGLVNKSKLKVSFSVSHLFSHFVFIDFMYIHFFNRF